MSGPLLYFSLAYAISWLIWLPLYAPALGWGQWPLLPYHHAWGGLGPLLAALISTLKGQGLAGVRELIRQCLNPRPAIYLLIALFSPFVLAVLAAGMEYFISDTPVMLSGLLRSKEFPAFGFVQLFFYNLIFFGLGEETGWRGFALPRLQQSLGTVKATLLLSFLWAVWHWPLFLYRPGYTAMDAGGVTGWFLSLLTGGVLLSWLYNASKGSVLICAVFHSTIDIVFTADLPGSNLSGYMGFLITVWGITTLIWLRRRDNSMAAEKLPAMDDRG